MTQFKKSIATALILAMPLVTLPQMAQAAMVSTEQSINTQDLAANRAKVETFFARADVQEGLKNQGVEPALALERVNAMSDAEVAQLAGRIDKAPAGGDILGVLFTVFIILLITDILGLTKVFPFTRSIR